MGLFVVVWHKWNLPVGWFPQSRLRKASWWLAPSSATADEPKPRPDKPALWLTGQPHSLKGPLARGTCCHEALTEVRTHHCPHSLLTLMLSDYVIRQQLVTSSWWLATYEWKQSTLTKCKNVRGMVYLRCFMTLKGLPKTEMKVVFNLWFHVQAQHYVTLLNTQLYFM